MRSQNLLHKAFTLPLGLIALYVVLLGSLTIPAIQNEVLYLHHVRIPLFADFDTPERYGLAPGKTRNLVLDTPDGEAIGAWHILPRSAHRSLTAKRHSSPDNQTFSDAFTQRPTIIYFHGNAATRAAYHRVRSYSSFSNILDCNVLAVDYRGFADSTGTPSEEGLLMDARTSWDYVVNHHKLAGVKNPEKMIILVGQSLGTGVVAALAGQLAAESTYPRALVLVAPYTSLPELLLEYKLVKVIPVLRPLAYMPSIQQYLLSHLLTTFHSAKALTETASPTLILHAIDDDTIPHSHSALLFERLRIVGETKPPEDIVTTSNYPKWGRISTFSREPGGEVIWWEGLAGGHNNVGWAEGTIDLIGRIADL